MGPNKLVLGYLVLMFTGSLPGCMAEYRGRGGRDSDIVPDGGVDGDLEEDGDGDADSDGDSDADSDADGDCQVLELLPGQACSALPRPRCSRSKRLPRSQRFSC